MAFPSLRRHAIRRWAWLVFIAAPATAAAAPPDASADDGAMASCLEAAASRLHFNGSALVRNEHGVLLRSFGSADAEGRVPVTAATRFNIGSAGKMFTAVAIAMLIERGALALDAPIGRYLEGLPPAPSAITLAQLLGHTSGLGDYLRPQNRPRIDAATTATQLLPLALAAPPAFAPGSRRSYSNSGYVVLGALIEKISGRTYEEFVRSAILEPLGMKDTRFDGIGAAVPMTTMSPAGPLAEPQPSPFRGQRASPAGGLASTTHDLSLFLGALAEGRLLQPATLRSLWQTAPASTGAEPYGLGFVVRIAPRLRIGHGGGAPGINAEIALYSESGTQLIALSNNDPPTASRLVDVLERAAFAEAPGAACDAAIDAAVKARDGRR